MCNFCEAARINGRLCHEHGCPEAWRDITRECKWCGHWFKPAGPEDRFCSEDCREAYHV